MAPMVVALIVVFISILLYWKTFLQPLKRLPPGPRPLPILGNLLLMKKSGSVHDLANDLRCTYGPIVSLWTGSTLSVIISGPDVITESMIKKGNIFVGRLHLGSTLILNNYNRGLTTGVGDRHRLLRKLVVSDIFNNSRLAGFRPIRDQEAEMLVETLRNEAHESGGYVTGFRQAIRLTVSNMLIGICFGRRLTLEEYLDIDKVMVQRFHLAMGKPRDFLPLLRLFPDKKGEKLQRELRKRVEDFFKPLIDERRQMLSAGKVPEKGAFVDTLLELQNGEQTIEITEEDVVGLCLEVLNAGTDTTSLNLEYAIANLINHPEIQEKLYQEISTVVGEKVVDESDIVRLPYLQAVVKECLRRHSPARLSPARVSLSATKLAGYDIPANTVVLQHLEAVALDPQIWENPLEFRPERFINRNVDITGSTELVLVPFGVGRRICPAINLAFLHAHLILGRIIQAFECRSATPGQLLNLAPDGGLSAPMKYPLKAVLRER